MNFQVGDIVKVSMDREYEYYSNGAIGKVAFINSDDMASVLVEFYEGDYLVIKDSSWWVYTNELELVARPSVNTTNHSIGITDDEEKTKIEVGYVYSIARGYYVLVATGCCQYCLISLENYNRWSEPMSLEEMEEYIKQYTEKYNIEFVGEIEEMLMSFKSKMQTIYVSNYSL